MRKLGITGSATLVRNVLARAGLPPAPARAGSRWRSFLREQGNTILACDLFTVDTVWLRRLIAAGSDDQLLGLGAESTGLSVRRRAAIAQRRPSAVPVAPPEPVAGRAARPAAGRGPRPGRTHPCSILHTISHLLTGL